MSTARTTDAYKPLSEVRQTLKVDWYRCPIYRARLRELASRSDAKGFLQTFGHLALLGFTGYLTHYFFATGSWVAFAFALQLHGVIFSFVPGLVTHELSHGTVFRTKWLNGFFLRLYSLISFVNFHHYKRSHTFHHMYTLHPEGDREVVLPANPTLRAIRIFGLFTFDARTFFNVAGGTLVLALTGKFRLFFKPEWSEAIFRDDPAGRKNAVNWARLVILFHAAIIAVGIAFELWMLPVVVTLGSFIGSWWKVFVGATMHAGLRDNVADFRKCARSVKLDPFSRFIYWNMNYHIEHHMFGAIPCYNLRRLSKEIAWDMPKPRSIREAWREMRDTWRRQQTDPTYQYDTPVPDNSPADGRDIDHETGASLGDLEPERV
jgi:fatty acid desaturase